MKKEKALLLSGKKNVDAAFAELKSAALPLIKYMAEKWHPHATAIVTSNSVEIVEGIMNYPNINDFLND